VQLDGECKNYVYSPILYYHVLLFGQVQNEFESIQAGAKPCCSYSIIAFNEHSSYYKYMTQEEGYHLRYKTSPNINCEIFERPQFVSPKFPSAGLEHSVGLLFRLLCEIDILPPWVSGL
jgi:hypothetical protein